LDLIGHPLPLLHRHTATVYGVILRPPGLAAGGRVRPKDTHRVLLPCEEYVGADLIDD
jgi:hypothetical protein